ncbi:MAG: ABC transporter ATP-binding protein [Promethearchaeota archaeon]|jgi:simple sugar transport system ATP-binding protein
MTQKMTRRRTVVSRFWDIVKLRKISHYTKDTKIKQIEPGESIVEMQRITKRFPGVLANDTINFELKAGEIHALLGENGAGKTTLMNILYGLYRFDSGEIKIQGVPVHLRSPKDAIAIGIGMVHQHFTLIPTMTVAENIILGIKSSKGLLLNLAEAEKKIIELSKNYNLEVDPKAKVEQLPMGIRQRVEIIKTLYRGAQILILDEPTSVLTPLEIEYFFDALKSMVKDGLTVVFITHKLPEVLAISDRVTVLRRGRFVDTVETKLTNPKDLSIKMVGREIHSGQEKVDIKPDKVVLEVQGLKTMNDKGQEALKGISFSIHEGEILGIAGISGNGQKELADVLSGMRPSTDGTIRFLKQDITNYTPKKLIEIGIGDVPEDRAGTGLLMNFSIAENLILESHNKNPFSSRQFLNNDEIRKYAEKIIQEYDIDTPSPNVPIRNLSGGNLQKVLLAKVLSRNPKLLIIAQPTAGLDIGATAFISKKILEEREKQVAILLISEDLEKIMTLSDRIAVIYEGKIVGIIPAADAKIIEIGRMMTGVEED